MTFYFSEMISACFAAGDNERGAALAREFSDYYLGRSGYLLDQKPSVRLFAGTEIANGLQLVSPVIQMCYANGYVQLAEEINTKFNELYSRYVVMIQ